MGIRVTRGRVVASAAIMAVVLGMASVAWACVGNPNETKFDVKDATGTVDATQGTTGQTLRAVGSDIDAPNSNYYVKLIAEPFLYDPNNPNKDALQRCGRYGTLQTVAKTGPGRDYPSQRLTSSFNQPFTLTMSAAGMAVGPRDSHFCALAALDPDVTFGLLEGPYIYRPFALTIV